MTLKHSILLSILFLFSTLVNSQCVNKESIKLEYVYLITPEDSSLKKIPISKINSFTKDKKIINLFTVLEMSCNEDSIFKNLKTIELSLSNNKWIIYSSNKTKKMSFLNKITSFHFSANRKSIYKTIYIDSLSGNILQIKKEKHFGIACSAKYKQDVFFALIVI